MPTVTVIQPAMAEEKNTVLRCAAYCRVSSDSEDQLNSLMAQTRYYGKFFENSETEILVDIYADEGVTGTREDKREEFQRMMKDCRRGRIDRIYTKSISRFARNTKDCLKNIRELKSLGITIFFEKENIDTANMTDELMITVMGGLAQEESTSISQNMRWSVQKRMQSGTYKIARPPFGFDIINGNLEVNEEQAQYITETLPHIKKRNYGEKKKYYVLDTNPPIMEKSVFETVQKILKERYRPYSNNGHLLSGKIYCAKCGATYKFKKYGNKHYWTCRTHDKKSDLCENGRIPEKNIYAAFVRLYNKLMYNYKQILVPLHTELQNLKLRKFNGNTNVMDIHKEIAKLKEQNHVLARLKTKGFLDNAKYLEQTSEISAKVNKLQSEMKKITRSDDEDETLEQLEMLIEYFEKQTAITEFDKASFEFLIERIVVVNQNELEFHLYGGLKLREMI